MGKKYNGNNLYACLFRKCCILVRVDATHQSSTTTSSTPSDPNFSAHKSRRRYQGGLGCVYTWTTHPTAHQADEARVVLVPCVARTLTKTSRLQLSLRVLNFSISTPRSNVNPMIEPIGWLRTLQFVATDACVTPRCRGRGSSYSFSRKNRCMCERTSACVHLFSSCITY